MELKHKIIITIYLISGTVLIAGGIFERNIFEIMLGITFLIDIISILNERISDKLIKTQEEVIKAKTYIILHLISIQKNQIRKNKKLNTYVNNYIIKLSTNENILYDID